MILTWAGGAPPYTIQKKTHLTDATWMDVLTTSVTTVPVPTQDESGFFRISGATP